MTRQWTDATEDEYAEWFKKNATADFFSNPNKPLRKQVPVDCAEVAYALRTVFAYEKGLPIRFLAQGKNYIDSEATSFPDKDPQERMIKFVKRVVANLHSYDFKYNSFPVKIDRRSLTPGVSYIFQKPGGHAEDHHVFNLREIGATGVFHFIWGTMPGDTRLLTERETWPFFFSINPSLNNEYGFRRFYQPNDYQLLAQARNTKSESALNNLKAALSRRGFSEKDQSSIAELAFENYAKAYYQYGKDHNFDVTRVHFGSDFRFGGRAPTEMPLPVLKDGSSISDVPGTPAEISLISYFQQIMVNRLHLREESNAEKFDRDFSNLCFYARERVYFVEEGYKYFFNGRVIGRNKMHRCATPKEIGDYATDRRDEEIRGFINGTAGWYFKNRHDIYKKNIGAFYRYEVLFNSFGAVNDNLMSPELRMKYQYKLDNEPLQFGSDMKCIFPINMHRTENGRPVYKNLHVWDFVKSFQPKLNPSSPSPSPWADIDRRWGFRAASEAEFGKEFNPDCGDVSSDRSGARNSVDVDSEASN